MKIGFATYGITLGLFSIKGISCEADEKPQSGEKDDIQIACKG
jgi:hypothetical protein